MDFQKFSWMRDTAVNNFSLRLSLEIIFLFPNFFHLMLGIIVALTSSEIINPDVYEMTYVLFIEMINECHSVSVQLHSLIEEHRWLRCWIQTLHAITRYSSLALRHQIRNLKNQHRATMEKVVYLQHRYMDLESEPWHWVDLGFEDFTFIPLNLVEIFENMRPPHSP